MPPDHFALQHPERLGLVVVGGLIGVALILWTYRGKRMWLAMLSKALLLLLLALLLLDPVMISERAAVGQNEVVVLVDQSASMGIAEQGKGSTRGETLLKAIASADKKAWAPWLEELRSTFRLRVQSVDSRVRSISDATSLRFDGLGSGISNAAIQAADRRGGSIAAVVMLTDGTLTDATLPDLAKDRAPIFAVMAAQQAPPCDLAITAVKSEQSAFEDAPVQLTVTMQLSGCANEALELLVRDDVQKTLLTERFSALAKDGSLTRKLRVPLAKKGLSFLTLQLRAPKLKGTEATLANNDRLIAVDRGLGPYRVLYVGGRPNWEHKFLRRALAADSDLQLPSLLRIAKREPKFEFRGRAGETSNPLFRGFAGRQQQEAQRYDQPVLMRLGTRDKAELADGFPATAEKLHGEYRAIILDDVEAAFFTQEQMNVIESFVSQRGGSLLMLGGAESLDDGGYANTPIARLLPIYVDAPTQPAPEDQRWQFTREGWLEPWLRLRPDQPAEEQRLAAMTAFHAVHPVASIKPGAIVMANTGTDNPALVMHRYGTGKVLTLGIADLWRWGMSDADQHRDQDKFWRQLVRSMVTDVPDRVTVSLRHDGDRMLIETRVRDAAFLPMDDATVTMTLTAPQATPTALASEPDNEEPGLVRSETYPSTPGAYRLTATVKDSAGNAIGESITGFGHDPLSQELAKLAPDQATMQRIAAESGGEVLPLSAVESLPEKLRKLSLPVMERRARPLWHSPWWMVIALGLLITEWALRRKGGVL